MAFKRLSNEQQETKADLEWLDQWFKSLPTKKAEKEALDATFIVKRVFKVKSGKGFILATDSFQAFCWNNSSDGKQLKEDLPTLVEAGFLLLLQIDKDSKQGFCLGIDPDSDLTCQWEVNEEQSEWKATNLPKP